MRTRVAAGGVVVRRDGEGVKVLLIKDSYGHWTWPKGHLEKGETPEQGALREITEETGQSDLSMLGEIGVQRYEYQLDGERIDKVVHIFLVEADGDSRLKIQLEEIAGGAWVPAAEAIDKIEYEGSRVLLEKGIEIYKSRYKA